MKDSEVINELKDGIVNICYSDYREQRYQKGSPLTYEEVHTLLDFSIEKYIKLLKKREEIMEEIK